VLSRKSLYALIGDFLFFKNMTIFQYSKLPFLNKRSHRQVVVFILVTIISNFLLFPVHAADENFEESFTESKIETIKAPETTKKLFEEFIAKNNQGSLAILEKEPSDFVKSFANIQDNNNIPLIDIYNQNKADNALQKVVIFNTESRLVTLTAYNSEVAQCDGDPCTTANGFNVCEHGIEDTVAANFLPLGTKIQIPELFGNRVFVVRDRTSKKYSDRVDVWMIEKQDALQFGKKRAHIVVLD
jgi:3D (Asp-Asp-Asp) domain-containing protein